MGNRLAQERAERGWKKAQLVHELRQAAARRRKHLVSSESLGRRIAIWENQDGAVSEFYRELLCEVYEKSAPELGLVDLPAAITRKTADLTDRLALSRLDSGIVELLRNHTQSIRMLDRRLGGEQLYEQTSAHVAQIEHLVRHTLPSAHREAAAEELSQAAALAGWQALNMGRLEDAWRFHELATSAARESGQRAGLIYASAQQAYVLLDADRTTDALAIIHRTRQDAGTNVPATLLAWLRAAEGEALATSGDRDAALRALDAAETALSSAGADDPLPYVMLDAGHLARWRGDCLVRLGDAGAIADLTSALNSIGEGKFGRAETTLHVDLAIAFRARGDLNTARMHARRASDLAGRIGSVRQRRRIADLLVG